MRRVDLIFAAVVIAVLAVFGCSTLNESLDAIASRAGMPPDLQSTNAELTQRTNELEAAEAHRKSVLAQATVFGTQDDKLTRQYLGLVEKNIVRLESRISKLEAWKQSLEAQAVQKQIDGATP